MTRMRAKSVRMCLSEFQKRRLTLLAYKPYAYSWTLTFCISPTEIMMTAVLGSRHYLQVPNSVIERIMVYMMNYFIKLKLATKMLFHKIAVVKHIFAFIAPAVAITSISAHFPQARSANRKLFTAFKRAKLFNSCSRQRHFELFFAMSTRLCLCVRRLIKIATFSTAKSSIARFRSWEEKGFAALKTYFKNIIAQKVAFSGTKLSALLLRRTNLKDLFTLRTNFGVCFSHGLHNNVTYGGLYGN